MGCCGGNHDNNDGRNDVNSHEHRNNDSHGGSRSNSRLPIIIGAIILAGLIYYMIK